MLTRDSSIESLLVFILSTSLMIGYVNYLKRNKTLKLSQNYDETLINLFQAVKNPSRHSIQANNLKSTSEIFEERKQYFQSLYYSAAVNNNRKFAKLIHIAGTKGKGSCCEYISSAISSEGYRVGVFTSPHLHTARERIKVGKSLISKEDLVRLGNKALTEMNDKPWLVFFDLLLHIAINYFYEQNVDYIVLETGIGGRYDSTNFLNNVDAAVLTSISLDHQAILGDTLEQIAWQKAGIIKPFSHVFTTSTQNPSVLAVFRSECQEKTAILHEIEPSISITQQLGLNITYDMQVQNACVAISVLNHLGLSCSGMKNFYWPCRTEVFDKLHVENSNTSSKLSSVILDGCHNGESVSRFLMSIKQKFSDKHILLLFGAGMEKCLDDMLVEIFRFADSILMVQSKHFKSVSEKQLLDMSTNYSMEKIIQPSFPDNSLKARLDWAISHFSETFMTCDNYVIVVCGSLFVAAEAREYLYEKCPKMFSQDDWVRFKD